MNEVTKSCLAGLTREELEAQAVLFLFAGYETTASALGHLVYFLALYPECQEQLRKEVDGAMQNKVGLTNKVRFTNKVNFMNKSKVYKCMYVCM